MARPVDIPREGERIAKLLARAGIASRREVERMIAEGRVAQDGVAVDTPALVLTSLDGITVDGEPVAAPEPARLFLYHKPPGLLVTERDPRGRPTIYDRLPDDLPRLVPVGRLDLNTEGLLLLTTDGGLKRQLELPATGVERAYRARVYGPVSQPQLESLMDGIEIDGFRYGPIDANMERRTGANSWIELTLAEGKNREVRRVLEHLGLEVSRLLRTRYGPFVLGDLPPGAIGEVRQADLHAFRQTLGRKAWPERVAVSAPIAQGTTRGRSPTARVPLDNTGSIARRPRTLPHPGAGRGPVAKVPGERNARSSSAGEAKRAAPQRNASQLGPGLRRGGAGVSVRTHDSEPGGRDARAAQPRTASHPGEGRGPVAKVTRGHTARAPRDGEAKRAASPRNAPQPGTDLRRGVTPVAERMQDKHAATGEADAPTPRPARIERKPGWARPKPKPGTRPPKKR